MLNYIVYQHQVEIGEECIEAHVDDDNKCINIIWYIFRLSKHITRTTNDHSISCWWRRVRNYYTRSRFEGI